MRCALCPEPSQRWYRNRVRLCLDHYQRARVKQLNDQEQEQLSAAFASPAPDGRGDDQPAQVPPGGTAPEEAEVV